MLLYNFSLFFNYKFNFRFKLDFYKTKMSKILILLLIVGLISMTAAFSVNLETCLKAGPVSIFR